MPASKPLQISLADAYHCFTAQADSSPRVIMRWDISVVETIWGHL